METFAAYRYLSTAGYVRTRTRILLNLVATAVARILPQVPGYYLRYGRTMVSGYGRTREGRVVSVRRKVHSCVRRSTLSKI
eukprot:SAG31_NODE_20493_length_573_cov_0.491561_1_plen_80_part_01